MEVTYKVGDLRKIIEESSNEFKAKLGPNVESEDKKNNGKAYKDAKKRAKDYDGGLSKELGEDKATYEKNDANKTTLDYTPENASEDYKKRVHAQVKGYTSVAEMENGLEKTGDFSDNDKIYQGIKKSGQEMHGNEEDFKRSGLQAREMPKNTFEKTEMYESRDGMMMRDMINSFKRNTEQPKSTIKETAIKTIYFKKTAFLTEGHMVSRIPDEFKKEGEQFKMKDKNGTEYIVEWKNGSPEILSYTNKNKINEFFDKFHKLSDYSSESQYATTKPTNRLNEESSINKMLDITRKLK